MHYRIFSILVTFVCLFGCALTTAAQDVNNTDETEKPVILYSGTPKKYEIADLVQKGELKPEQIDSELISRHLTTHFMPDPDLLIRTGGELRLSNYMLWQCAYSELYFCDTYWPDFREEELRKAICDYQKRERRFGKTSEQIN